MRDAVAPAVREKLDRIDLPAILLSRDHRILATNRAYVERYGDAVRFGRSRCHHVSHGYDSPCDENGESCPVRACLATGRPSRVLHVHHGPEGPEHCDIEVQPVHGPGGEVIQFIEIIRPEALADRRGGRSEPLGRSPAFRRVLELVERVAPSEVPVLLLGETGTGKEILAAAIHARSGRRAGPLVPVECSGLTETLFESELFGHERGAFTGAVARKDGLVDAARRGTLFLDEIGDVPPNLQVKLLRLLESGTYRRVGGTEPLKADFRLVCATHRDLAALVREGRFREDLYYRINTFPIRLPPLRERPGDIALLARHFLRGTGRRLSTAALARLERHPFPGNVRELRNLLERAVLLCDGPEIRPEHLLPDAPNAAPPTPEAPGPWPWGDAVLPLAEVERRYLRWAESRIPESRDALAHALGVSKRTLYRKLREAHRTTAPDEA